MHLPKGFVLNNTYQIDGLLGQGGFGITYLATDLNLGRKVAVKEFFPKEFCEREGQASHVLMGTAGSKELVSHLKQKFIKEARTIAQHDECSNIIRIYSAFEANNTAYYVMEYIEGETLSEMVKRRGALPPAMAIEYICKAGEALKYVHSFNINHLDVKPANILVKRNSNSPVLIDFGLSKHYDYEGHQTSTTPTGISYGFAPIEQYRTGGLSEFSPETDIYSLGATLYYLLTATVPPQAIDLVSAELTFPADFPPYLIPILKKAMAVQKKDRYHSITEFLHALALSTSSQSHISSAPDSSESTRVINPVPVKKPIVAEVEKASTPRTGKANRIALRFLGWLLIFNIVPVFIFWLMAGESIERACIGAYFWFNPSACDGSYFIRNIIMISIGVIILLFCIPKNRLPKPGKPEYR